MRDQFKFAFDGGLDAERNLKDLEKALNRKFGTQIKVTNKGAAKAKRMMR